jgi:heparin binding hemagglutinin HbhA
MTGIEGNHMAKKNGASKDNTARKTPTVDDLKDPLLAAVGVLDLALEQLDKAVGAMRERAEEARADATTRAEETRERLTKRRQELRERLTAEELRDTYQNLTERGEAVLARLRAQTSTEPDDPTT